MTTDEAGNTQAAPGDEQAIAPIPEAGDAESLAKGPDVILPLHNGSLELDLSALPDEQRIALLDEYARGQIKISERAMQLGVDARALDLTLKSMTAATEAVSAQSNSVTITNTQDSSLGRTEIIMGNTEQAEKGRLTKSQTGERDMKPYLIGLGIVIAAVLGILLLSGG